MGRNVVRDLAGLGLAVLGALAVLALGTLLASRQDWLALGLLVGGAVFLGCGIRLGHYDPAERAPRETGLGDDAIEMRPVVRGEGDSPTP
jgi:hypothetical protein